MKVLVNKSIENARYYVTITVKDFTREDQQKMQKFGSPIVSIHPKEILYNGDWVGELPLYDFYATFEFVSESDAEDYLVEIKERLKQSLDYLRSRQDTFSKQEVSEF